MSELQPVHSKDKVEVGKPLGLQNVFRQPNDLFIKPQATLQKPAMNFLKMPSPRQSARRSEEMGEHYIKTNLEKYEQMRLKHEAKPASSQIQKALKRITHDCKLTLFV